MLAQLRQVQRNADQILRDQHALGVDVGNGIFLEFRGEPEFDLQTESLDRRRSGIELVNVKQEGESIVATVFVPEGCLDRFEKLVTDYAEKESQNGRPKNEKLVSQIRNIRLAVIDALWMDDRALLPREGEVVWWEVWLRVGDDRRRSVAVFKDYARRIGLEVTEGHIDFPERLVVSVRGTKAQLSRSIHLLNSIAELRRPKDTAEFFVELTPSEQREWMNELLGRIQPAPADSPFVSILDTGINQPHPLIGPVLNAADLDTVNAAWGTGDQYGHGTQMAGLAAYGDLVEALGSRDPVVLTHRLESVKLLQRPGPNAGELYGDLTREAIARAEILGPNRKRVTCMAVTSTDGRDRGRPSTWSATIDALCAGVEDETKRLIVVAAGSIDQAHWRDYPARNSADSIHDPGQAWNAVTIGGYTEKIQLDARQYPGWTLVAQRGGLAPSSCTSQTWETASRIRNQWPLKPDVVLEGGNGARDTQNNCGSLASLDLLTTFHDHLRKPFVEFGDTSAATAVAAQMAARIQGQYPDFWPETTRALIVHSADWTQAMLAAYAPRRTKTEIRSLIRHCGYGVPSVEAALWSAANALTLVVQEELQPFDEIVTATEHGQRREVRSRDMHLHAIPWPRDVLLNLGDANVEMRVTLSYFIEPNPAERGWTRRYRYESHGLRFDVKRQTETVDEFRHRVNLYARQEEEGNVVESADENWVVGYRNRHLGSIHSDRWRGNAADLAERGFVSVYPALGWWRERKHLERWRKRARYALIISVSTPGVDVDIYSEVAAQIAAPIAVEIPV